jgi:hypothetical protein
MNPNDSLPGPQITQISQMTQMTRLNAGFERQENENRRLHPIASGLSRPFPICVICEICGSN